MDRAQGGDADRARIAASSRGRRAALVGAGPRSCIAAAGFQPRDGICAVEARPPIGWDKGQAVLHILRQRYGPAWSERVRIIYLGDDQTDEDAFRVLAGLGVTFRIGAPTRSPSPSTDCRTSTPWRPCWPGWRSAPRRVATGPWTRRPAPDASFEVRSDVPFSGRRGAQGLGLFQKCFDHSTQAVAQGAQTAKVAPGAQTPPAASREWEWHAAIDHGPAGAALAPRLLHSIGRRILMAAIDALMATEMITASPEEPVREVAARMARSRVGAVLVVRDGRLVGLFSERDLLSRVVAAGLDPGVTRVGDVDTRDVVSIDVEQSVRSVLEVFRTHRFRHLPVLRAGRPVGILSTRDFLAFVVSGLERFVEQARYDQSLASGVDPYDHVGGSYGR